MTSPQTFMRRTEPSAALIPVRGQRKLVYVPAALTDIRKRIDEFKRNQVFAVHTRLA